MIGLDAKEKKGNSLLVFGLVVKKKKISCFCFLKRKKNGGSCFLKGKKKRFYFVKGKKNSIF